MGLRSQILSDALRCSFCRKSQDQVSKLISSPAHEARSYICDECIAVCHSIVEGDPATGAGHPAESGQTEEGHALLQHPLASRFLASAEHWIQQEAAGGDAAAAFAEMRALAVAMMANNAGGPTPPKA